MPTASHPDTRSSRRRDTHPALVQGGLLLAITLVGFALGAQARTRFSPAR